MPLKFDVIPYTILRHIQDIQGIYNRMWNNSYIPAVWKSAIMLSFFKADKDPFISLHYWLISLMHCMMKLFEDMVNIGLVWFF